MAIPESTSTASGKPGTPVKDGLICAYLFDGQGGGHEISWTEIKAWRAETGMLWVHLDPAGTEARRWLHHDRGLDPVIVRALLAKQARPRELRSGDALLVILRGVNLNPGAKPEDMVAVRIWLEPSRVVTVGHRRLAAIDDVREALGARHGPSSAGAFLVMLSDRLTERMEPVIDGVIDEVDRLEDALVTGHSAKLVGDLARVRRKAISLHRYLALQREIMDRLASEQASCLAPDHKALLREISARTTRLVEDLAAARDRAGAVHDEQINLAMYRLSVVATIALPATFLAGLFGLEVGGMLEHPLEFIILVALTLGLALVGIAILRRLKWI